jgi:hypothetical protein
VPVRAGGIPVAEKVIPGIRNTTPGAAAPTVSNCSKNRSLLNETNLARLLRYSEP